MRSKILKIIVLIFLLTSYGLIKYRLDQHVRHRALQADVRYLLTPETAKVLAFGFKSALADFFWIEAINYYGSELSNKKRTYTYLPAYCDLILNLDPYFAYFYEWAGTAFIYNGLPITRNQIVSSTRYVNKGIKTLFEIFRFANTLIEKGAFNYASEASQYKAAIPYFVLSGRTFAFERKMLLVAATYAKYAGDFSLYSKFRLEYLAYEVFEATSKQELIYAINLLSDPSMELQIAESLRLLRINMEKDEDMKKVVEMNLQKNQIFQKSILSPQSDLITQPQLQRLMSIEFDRTWLPPELHVLFSL